MMNSDHRNYSKKGSHCQHTGDGGRKTLLMALIITSIFMLVEVIGGIISGSLALIADAGHMLTDAGALLLAFAAASWSLQPADSKRSYGFGRVRVLAAFANGIALLALTIWILFEAIGRFTNPQPIQSIEMLIVALVGLMVNIIVFKMLHNSSEQNINIRGAMIHVLGDLLGSLGAIVAALLIYWKGWLWTDPLLSIFVAMLIVRSALILIKESSHILIEGTPSTIKLDEVVNSLEKIAGVKSIHHLHAWSLNEKDNLMTMHIHIERASQHSQIISEVNKILREEFEVEHCTLQLELEKCDFTDC